MMNNDWTEGFKEGFKIGLEEGKRNQNLNPVPYTQPYEPLSMLKDKCPKCGITISGMMGYVCSSVNCPTFYTVSYYEPKGVMGKNSLYGSSAPGTNGPSGPIDYSMR
jgi:hypothetical protein